MKILEIYKTLLKEAEIESCVKKFGHELFGHELGGKEANTGIENSYVRDISDFTDNKYGEETSPEFVKAVTNLKGCMKQYPEVLIPESTKVYRGITIPVKYFIDKKQVIDLNNPIDTLIYFHYICKIWDMYTFYLKLMMTEMNVIRLVLPKMTQNFVLNNFKLETLVRLVY